MLVHITCALLLGFQVTAFEAVTSLKHQLALAAWVGDNFGWNLMGRGDK